MSTAEKRMRSLSAQIADWCGKYEAVPEQEYPVFVYGLQVILNGTVKIAGILLLGILFGHGWETVICLLVFCSMRYRTGGYHSNTHIGCFSAMLLPCFLPPFFMEVTGSWVPFLLVLAGVTAFLTIVLYAPVNSKVNPITSKELLRKNRIISITECALLLAAALFIRNTAAAWLIVMPLWIDGMLLLPLFCGHRVKTQTGGKNMI